MRTWDAETLMGYYIFHLTNEYKLINREPLFIKAPDGIIPSEAFDEISLTLFNQGFGVTYQGEIPLTCKRGLLFESVPDWFITQAQEL